MTRIRSIKPEFWHDEKLAPMSPVDRLTFLGLISMADDYGRVHDNLKVIDAFIFPETSDTVRESVANLSRIGRIERGNSSSGMKIIQIVNWDKHQKVDKPQPQKALPPIAKAEKKTDENTGNLATPESVADDSRIDPEAFAKKSLPLSPISDPLSPIPDNTHTQSDSKQPLEGVQPEQQWAKEWSKWIESWEGRNGTRFDEIKAQIQLGELLARKPDKAKRDLEFSLSKYSKNILDSDDDFSKRKSRNNKPPEKPLPSFREANAR
jgi:hypothetical protein